MDGKIIVTLIATHSDNPELVRLCVPILKNLEDVEANRALKYFLLKNNIPAEEYHKNFHSVCYETVGTAKIWLNEEGKRHCTQVGEDGKILPAYIHESTQEWWKDGLRFSPGVDENGKSLPSMIMNGDKLWLNSSGHYGRDEIAEDGTKMPNFILADGTMQWLNKEGSPDRNEFAEDGSKLPEIIKPDGTMEWRHEGKTLTKEEIDKVFPPRNQDKVIELKGRKMRKITFTPDNKMIIEYDAEAKTCDVEMQQVKTVDFGDEKIGMIFKDEHKMEIDITGLKVVSFSMKNDNAILTVQ